MDSINLITVESILTEQDCWDLEAHKKRLTEFEVQHNKNTKTP